MMYNDIVNNSEKYPYLTEFSVRKVDLPQPISIVMGHPCTGKSTFIAKKFTRSEIIDLYKVQKAFKKIPFTRFRSMASAVVKANEVLINLMVNAILLEKDVVVESTLFKAKRRKMLVKEIREISLQPIHLYMMYPSLSQFISNCKERKESEENSQWDMIEFPSYEEGFDEIYYVNGDDVLTQVEFLKLLMNTEDSYERKDEIIQWLQEETISEED